MWRYTSILGTLFLTVCFCFQANAEVRLSHPVLAESLAEDLFDQKRASRFIEGALSTITEQEIKDNLYHLASADMEGRGSGYPGDERAAEYIEQKFEEYGLVPAYGDSYRQKFSISAGRGYTWNLIGYIPGYDPELKDEVVIIGAHYDHLGKSGSSIYYGADDNGTGSVSLIEVAEACNMVRPQMRRTVC